MKCDGFRCPDDATFHPGIVQADGSEKPWHLCSKHYAAYVLELADREAKNAADDARADSDWRASHAK